mmetsp:Transcript_96161/g.272240  ORF Transcript_96161/g.272240 Transcript_96161/m.272240 type:complete len:290 (-) Transcript_96161:865-1734(-)
MGRIARVTKWSYGGDAGAGAAAGEPRRAAVDPEAGEDRPGEGAQAGAGDAGAGPGAAEPPRCRGGGRDAQAAVHEAVAQRARHRRGGPSFSENRGGGPRQAGGAPVGLPRQRALRRRRGAAGPGARAGARAAGAARRGPPEHPRQGGAERGRQARRGARDTGGHGHVGAQPGDAREEGHGAGRGPGVLPLEPPGQGGRPAPAPRGPRAAPGDGARACAGLAALRAGEAAFAGPARARRGDRGAPRLRAGGPQRQGRGRRGGPGGPPRGAREDGRGGEPARRRASRDPGP